MLYRPLVCPVAGKEFVFEKLESIFDNSKLTSDGAETAEGEDADDGW